MSAIPTLNAEQLFRAAFAVPRDQRSPEYKAGVRAVLEYRINRLKFTCPYPMGTSQADAYLSGTTEGHRIFRAAEEALRNHLAAAGTGE